MNEVKIKVTGELVRRWKEQTKSGKEMVYIAVKVERGQYFDVFRIKAKDVETVKPFEVGKNVTVEAFVGGREWTNPTTNKIAYFVDINLWKIESAEKSEVNDDHSATVQYDDVAEDMPF